MPDEIFRDDMFVFFGGRFMFFCEPVWIKLDWNNFLRTQGYQKV